MANIGVLHPGAMGSALGAAAMTNGHRVRWCSAGRSADTHARAAADQLIETSNLDQLLSVSEVVLSVCPPAAALEVAAEVAGRGYDGLYVDANAIAPRTALDIAEVVVAGGATFVDGGIVGPPPREPGSTRLYLSGPGAPRVAALFRGSALQPIVIDDRFGSASALKSCFAAWTKGTAALLLAIAATADRYEVGDALRSEWQTSMPELADDLEMFLRRAPAKAWRFVAEMEQIALAMDHAGQPATFHLAAAEVYDRLARFKDAGEVDPAEVLKALQAE